VRKVMAIVSAMVLSCSQSAFAADALAIAKAHDSGVTKAVKDCKPQEMVDMYEDDAIAVYPGEGEIGRGKAEIKGLVEKFFTAFCPDDRKKFAVKDVSFDAIPLGPNYIMIIRIADATDKDGNTARFRATELIHKSDGKWRYVVDHASIGIPPEATNTAAPPAN
jgi:uncharacterized protein (TIGR02246 family)